jgi:hypothetical protein
MTPNDSARPDDHAAPDQPVGTEAVLSQADQRAVDLLIEHGFDVAAASAADPALRSRIEAASRLFACTERYPLEPVDPSLVDATLARIDRTEEERAERMRVTPERNSTGGRGRWADFIAIACVALLAVSIGVPLLSQLQHRKEIEGCAANMRSIGSALATYSGDFDGRPLAAGIAPDLSALTSWAGYDNSRHLDVLHERGYCDRACLCCGNDKDRQGYASQVPNERMNRAWRQPSHLPLLADRNPLIVRTILGHPIGTAVENSLDHGGDGQNVLFADLTISFEGSPILRVRIGADGEGVEENIWVPASRNGTQDGLHAPSEWSAIDVFLMQ